jgi:hypothetical protein
VKFIEENKRRKLSTEKIGRERMTETRKEKFFRENYRKEKSVVKLSD